MEKYTEKFKKALRFVLKWEGGYSEHPNDPGGATMKGIIQSVYDAWRKSKGLPQQPVKLITDDEVYAIYWERYWSPLKGDKLPEPLDLVVFDSGVNCGVGRAARWLNTVLGLGAQTTVTPQTLEALKKKDAKEVAKQICGLRVEHYHKIAKANPKLLVFLKGWMNRMRDLMKTAKLM